MKYYKLIFLNNSKVFLSKKAYSDWREIQTEFDNYTSSLDFESINDLIEYLVIDYKIPTEIIRDEINKINQTEKIELTL